ncbi:ankyrin repeat domain-containing protein [archaeon]|nr:MAG: ankyrin repeat domain-containing protein [archaeon]
MIRLKSALLKVKTRFFCRFAHHPHSIITTITALNRFFNQIVRSQKLKMDEDTPRSYTSPRDDRFFTPRTIARSNSTSTNGNSEDWQTPRFGTEGEFQTPRSYLDTDRKDSARLGLPLSQRSNGSRGEAAHYDNNYAAQAKQYYASSYDGYYQSNQYEAQAKRPSIPIGSSAKHSQESYEKPVAIDEAPSHISEQDVEDIFRFTRHGRVDEIEILLTKGVPVDIRDTYGNTLLIIACQNGNKRVAKALLRRGANINARNYKGNTPLHYCYHCKYLLLACLCLTSLFSNPNFGAYPDGYGESLGQYIISKVSSS